MVKKEKFITAAINSVNASMDLVKRSYNMMHKNNGTYIKNIARENGQGGYRINPRFGDVLGYMIENDLKKIVDLGAGAGHGIHVLRKAGFHARGYEIDDKLIAEHRELFTTSSIIKKDILKLIPDDIQRFEIIYFWDPFQDNELRIKFFEHVYKNMFPGQIILYARDNGSKTKTYLHQLAIEKIDFEEHGKYLSLHVFKKT